MSTKDRGFASMDEDQQKEIASMGGKASHKNDSDSTESRSSQKETSNSSHSSGKQGFGSMDKEKQKEIASKGGKN